MDWLDLLAVRETLKSLLQHYSSKPTILQRSAFFTVQLSYPYMTTGKTIALTRQILVGKVMSLLFNMLSQFSSVAQSCLTLCDPMNRSMPGLRPSPTPVVHSDSGPSSWWCHPAISSSVVPFFSCPQSLPASKSFAMSQLFTCIVGSY